MKEKIRLGLIGFGCRGTGLLHGVLLHMSKIDIELCGVCDLYYDRAKQAADIIEGATGKLPLCTTDYKEIVAMDIDAVIIMSAWESHVEIALAAMNAGKPVGMEVGGAYSLDDCWSLVHTSEKTGMPCMLLENCCYGKRELMILNMVKKGLFGDVVYCEGGYHHDLREEIAYGDENRHYRLRNYINRNCDNYPTHELGPIAKVLNINNGNRMLSLTSTASCSKGMHKYIIDKKGTECRLADTSFMQGDIVKTNIKCAHGELISLTLDTTLPRCYSRGFTVRGTAAAYFEDTDSIFIDGKDNRFEFNPEALIKSADKYEDKYLHPLWKNYVVQGGHGGIDWLVFRAFIEAVKAGVQTPIDVYDTASWMCISALSEQSIASGGMPQSIPDFTGGAWIDRRDIVKQKYGLDRIV